MKAGNRDATMLRSITKTRKKMPALLEIILIFWNLILTLLFFFDKSRIDALEHCISLMFDYVNSR